MGLFTKFLGNIVDNISFMGNEVSTSTVIARLMQDDRVKNNEIIKKILNIADKLEMVYFGEENMPNPTAIYSDFYINESEILIASIRTKGIFGSSKLIITNRAIYILPSLAGNSKDSFRLADATNEFPLSDFCKYVAYIDQKDNVRLFGIDKDVDILKISKDAPRNSLITIINTIQSELLSDGTGVKDKESLFQYVLTKAKELLKDGQLEEPYPAIIDYFCDDKKYCLQANELLLFNALQFNDRDTISSLLDNIIKDCNAENLISIKNDFTLWINKFLSNLKSADFEFRKSYIENIKPTDPSFRNQLYEYNNTFKDEILRIFDEKSLWINTYLYIRKNPMMNYKGIVDSYYKYYSDKDTINEVIKFALHLKNHIMIPVFENIRNNKDISKKSFSYTDGFGFNVLHYAIILNNKEQIENLLKHMSELPKVNSSLLSYGFIYLLCGQTELTNELMEYTDDIKPLLDVRKNIKFQLTAKQALYKASKAALSRGKDLLRAMKKANNANYDAICEQVDRIDNMTEQVYSLEEEIRALNEDLRDIETEIYECKNILIQEYKELADEVKKSTDPYEKCLILFSSKKQQRK